MEQKFKSFQDFDWSNNQGWQSYFSNLFPTPPLSKVERFKRKWYRDNVDKDFDVTYQPSEQPDSNQNT